MRLNKKDTRTPAELREHYLIERELADRLRQAPTPIRRQLYNVVYEERSRRIRHHPLVVRAVDERRREEAAVPQWRLLKPLLRPETVFLEIGTGDGGLALAVARDVRQVHATDVTDSLVQGVEWPDNAQFHLSDGLSIPLPDKSVDLAYSNQVMEHLHPEDALAQLANLYRVLRPGGHYLCITPNRLSGPHDISAHFDNVATGFHLKEYTIGELASLLRKACFRRVRVFLSFHGYRLSPLLPVLPFSTVEWAVERLPATLSRLRREISCPLVAAKVLATR